MSHTTPEDFLNTRIGVVQDTIAHFKETVANLEAYEAKLQKQLAEHSQIKFAHPDFGKEENHADHSSVNRL